MKILILIIKKNQEKLYLIKNNSIFLFNDKSRNHFYDLIFIYLIYILFKIFYLQR